MKRLAKGKKSRENLGEFCKQKSPEPLTGNGSGREKLGGTGRRQPGRRVVRAPAADQLGFRRAASDPDQGFRRAASDPDQEGRRERLRADLG